MSSRFQPRSLVAVAALVLVACHEHVGCTPVLTGGASQLQFHDVVLVADACDRMHAARALVTGSRFCPTLGCHPDVPGCGEDDDALTTEQVRACYDDTLAGPVETTADGCIVAMAAGELDWSFTPIDCAAMANGYMPAADRLRLPIVAVEEVTAWLEAPGDAFAVRELVTDTGDPFPDDAQLPSRPSGPDGPGREALVLAGERVPFAVVLGHPDHADPVAWNPDAWTIEADGAGVEWKAHGVVEVTLSAGASVELAIHRAADDVTIPVGTVRAVAADAIASLDVVVGFARDDDAPDGHRMPIGARAVARTVDGAPVWGIPVEWEVTEGALPVWRDAALPWSSDYVALMDREGRACHAPPEHATTYDATIVARWGNSSSRPSGPDFQIETPMRWREEGIDESAAEEIKKWFTGEDHEDADACEGPGFPSGGCSCTSSRSGPGVPGVAFAVLFALGLVRSRRCRARTAGVVAGRIRWGRRSCSRARAADAALARAAGPEICGRVGAFCGGVASGPSETGNAMRRVLARSIGLARARSVAGCRCPAITPEDVRAYVQPDAGHPVIGVARNADGTARIVTVRGRGRRRRGPPTWTGCAVPEIAVPETVQEDD